MSENRRGVPDPGLVLKEEEPASGLSARSEASTVPPSSGSGGGAGVGAFVLGVIAEHTGLRPPIATAAVIGMVIWYTVWRQRNVIVKSLQTTTTPSGLSGATIEK